MCVYGNSFSLTTVPSRSMSKGDFHKNVGTISIKQWEDTTLRYCQDSKTVTGHKEKRSKHTLGLVEIGEIKREIDGLRCQQRKNR